MSDEIPSAEVVEAYSGTQPSTIELSLEFFPLAFFFFFCTPVVVINGKAAKLPWGRHRNEFPPGDYTIKVYFAYFFMSECGANSVSFRLDPGATRQVTFYMWPWIYAKGQMSVR